MAVPKLRRTRIVCISDTHNCTVKLPAGDVLIHAGDLTNQGSYSELSRAVKWLEDADFEAKIVVAGNHDITLDEDFYSHHGVCFHNTNEQSPSDCRALLTSSPSITYLCHDSATIRLSSPSGPRTEFTVFGSPYSPRHGLWAFYYDAPDSSLMSLWGLIPLETDIVVTHTPPRSHRDTTDEQRPSGCEALRRALWRVRPRLAVCGHIHDGRGAERVLWDLECRETPYATEAVAEWEDTGSGNNKLSLVDLTGRKQPMLANDGSHPGRPSSDSGNSHDQLVSNTTLPTTGASQSVSQHGRLGSSVGAQGRGGGGSGGGGTMGFGGYPESDSCDGEALAGRVGRRETCVVNAAMMRSRYPHVGGKQLNKPIVVDVNLPVWEDEEEEEEDGDDKDDEDDEGGRGRERERQRERETRGGEKAGQLGQSSIG